MPDLCAVSCPPVHFEGRFFLGLSHVCFYFGVWRTSPMRAAPAVNRISSTRCYSFADANASVACNSDAESNPRFVQAASWTRGDTATHCSQCATATSTSSKARTGDYAPFATARPRLPTYRLTTAPLQAGRSASKVAARPAAGRGGPQRGPPQARQPAGSPRETPH
jgi:hypothetical protein